MATAIIAIIIHGIILHDNIGRGRAAAVVFVNRRLELGRIEQLAQDAKAGAPERHLALIGVRRIGKSVLLQQFRTLHPGLAVAEVRMDAAATTLPIWLRSMLRATLNGLLARRGLVQISKGAGDEQLLARVAEVEPSLAGPVAEAVAAMREKRTDGQRLLELGLEFPELAAKASDEPVLVMADEFQYLLALATYAPFAGRASGQPRRRDATAREALLAVVRATIERPPHVGWLVTGSSVRMLMEVLGSGPLMGRFDILQVQPFDEDDTRALAEAVWAEVGVDYEPASSARLFRMTQGHPFYADVTCREAATLARRLEQRVEPDLVNAAFASALHQPQGQIAIACREMYDSLASRTPALRGFLDALAVNEPASPTDLATTMGLAAPLAYRYADELVSLGLIEQIEGGQFAFADPVFRYWVARANDPVNHPPAAFDMSALRRLARSYEEGYLRERDLHGPLSEGYVRNLCRSFHGQVVDGKYFGRKGARVRLPNVHEVTSIEATDPTGATLDHPGQPVRVELDLSFGSDPHWLGEVKRTTDRVTGADVQQLVRKAAFLRKEHHLADGPVWYVSFSGFARSGHEAAASTGVYLSGERDLKGLQAQVGTRR